MSSSLTVGFVREREFSISPYGTEINDNDQPLWNHQLTMVTGGSYNFSPSTSTHVISIAPGSPGEHGVKRSSTMFVLSSGDGPRIL